MEPTFMMSLKIYWSLAWRTFVAGAIAAIGLVLVGLAIFFMMFGFHSMQDIMHGGAGHAMGGGFAVVMFLLVFVYFVLMLYIYRWALNCLPEITYKEGRVLLMKHSMPIEKFGLFDSICISWSVAWRIFVLMIPYIIVLAALFMLLGVPVPKPGSLLSLVDQIIKMVIYFLGFYWMLARKKEGRYLSLEARHDGA